MLLDECLKSSSSIRKSSQSAEDLFLALGRETLIVVCVSGHMLLLVILACLYNKILVKEFLGKGEKERYIVTSNYDKIRLACKRFGLRIAATNIFIYIENFVFSHFSFHIMAQV